MPFGNIKVIEGVFTNAEKRQMIERVTEALISVEGERLRDRPWSSLKKREAVIGKSAEKR
jgi:4-oxalocrotonate tautomerase